MAVREQVSGPGSQSKRTDMNVSKQPVRYMSGGTYGEGQESLALQQGADMYAAPAAPAASAPTQRDRRSVMASMSPSARLTDPSNRPGEPLSTGMNFDSSTPGFDSLNLPPIPPQPTLQSELEKLLPGDNTGKISAILNQMY